MTQEEKQLLLRDLCGRLPYKVKGLHREQVHTVTNIEPNSINPIIKVDGYDAWFPIELFKPYLRSMSSMTDEEFKTYEYFLDEEGLIDCSVDVYVDWLLERHFDFRGLIPKGLALEAPEDMYNTKIE